MSRDVKKTAQLPYQDWWQNVAQRTQRRHREVVFQMGRAPINLPPQPARLELICKVAPLSEDFSGLSTEQLLTNTAPAGFFGAKNTLNPHGRHVQKSTLPRSFSGECCQVISDQSPIEFFDSLAVYRSCPLFQRCSPGFIQKLMTVGGKSAWNGKIFECGSTIYSEGQRESCMYLIIRGSIALVSGASKQIIGPGECIGVAQGLGVLAERQETAMAETSVHVLEVTLSALTTIFTEKEEFHNSSGGEPLGNYYTRERRLFEMEARRLGAEKRGLLHGGRTRRVREEDGVKATKSLKRPIMPFKKHQGDDDAAEPRGMCSASHHISCLQHPRQWRQQVQKLQKELIDGDFTDMGRAKREAFLQSLSASITQDFNNGCLQPIDSPFRAAMDERHDRHEQRQTPNHGEEEVEEVTTGMLELSLLPAFQEMSCKQKVDLFHHMNAQNKAHANRRPAGSQTARGD